MFHQKSNPFSGTALEYFRIGKIKTFVDHSETSDSQWSFFGRPENVQHDKRYDVLIPKNVVYGCDFIPTRWLDKYTIENALNDLMNFYVNVVPKIPDYKDDGPLLKPFGFNCEIGKLLNIDFSNDFYDTISGLIHIVQSFVKLSLELSFEYLNPVLTYNLNDASPKVVWIQSELLPTLIIWIAELHIKRASLPIYTDLTFNYVTQVFLLLQSKSYILNGEEIMMYREILVSNETTEDTHITDFINGVNATYTKLLSDIKIKINDVIDKVNQDPNLSTSEKHVTLAGIYNSLYNADKAHTADKTTSHNVIIKDYKSWLDQISMHCKLVNNLTKKGSGAYIKDSTCTLLGAWTRRPVDPFTIKKLGLFPTPIEGSTSIN
jgi:hypothetical protein